MPASGTKAARAANTDWAPPRFVRAALGAGALIGFELAAVVIFHRREFTSDGEFLTGVKWLGPILIGLALCGACVGEASLGALSRPDRLGRGVFATIWALAVGVVTAYVTTGRHFEAPLVRVSAVAAVGGAVFAAVYALAPWIAGLHRRWPAWLGAAAFAKAIFIDLANHAVLVRLYPAFHTGLALIALSVAAFGVAAATPPKRRAASDRAPAAWALGVVALALAAALAAKPAAEKLAWFDNFRLVLVEHAPVLAEAVRGAAWLAPPAPIGDADPCALDPTKCAASGASGDSPNFAGRDIVLLTIDALRADHVGAYGYARPTTPEIDALARSAVVFDHAYCPAPHTSYSVTSLMTGKYMRPLLLEGAGQDSETLATYLRTYGYRTAAFYPPAVFFIDEARFDAFSKSRFGFEYQKVEFMEGEGRVRQVADYFGTLPPDQRLFLWVHLFGPHEPYEAHPEHPFGDRDVDRYDSEIAEADGAVGGIVRLVREKRPNAVVIVTADHGEEFGDHGGRYHGSSVYEEQVRVPLVVSAPGLLSPKRVQEVVQTIDVMPTLLGALSIPPSPRIRGRDLGSLLTAKRAEGPGMAFAETDDDALYAEGSLRLVCARKLGACRLYDVAKDPTEQTDLRATDGADFDKMRAALDALGASHGRFEQAGLRAETGKGWPAPILRAIAGDANAAPDLAVLLDDADRDIRRKAAELLFEVARPETAASLRLALGRDEDPLVRKWCALALTRFGEAAPLAADLLDDPDPKFRRLSAMVLAEAGDRRGEALLVDWWQHGATADYERAREVLTAFAKIRSKDAVWPLVQSLKNVRLRPYIAATLAAIGDKTARGPLVAALSEERYQTARVALADALEALGAKEELAKPLVRFLGVPDPLPGGVGYAEHAGVLEYVGGPDKKGLAALQRQASVGVVVHVVVPKTGNGSGVRVVVRARSSGAPGEVRVGKRLEPIRFDSKGEEVNPHQAPKIHDRDFARLPIPEGASFVEVSATLPPSLDVRAGRPAELVVYAEPQVTLEALAVVPLANELPPPPPEAWTPDSRAAGAP